MNGYMVGRPAPVSLEGSLLTRIFFIRILSTVAVRTQPILLYFYIDAPAKKPADVLMTSIYEDTRRYLKGGANNRDEYPRCLEDLAS